MIGGDLGELASHCQALPPLPASTLHPRPCPGASQLSSDASLVAVSIPPFPLGVPKPRQCHWD